jgi:fatty-acyl-CoA synthase
VAGVGAEMIRTEMLETFAKKLLGSGFDYSAFLPCYGMAECSLAVCFGTLEEKVEVDHIDADQLAEYRKAVKANPLLKKEKGRVKGFVSCGVLLPDYEAEIRNAEGQVLPERECGILYLRGPSVMTGYFGDLKATSEVLSTNGWLNTGDIAYLADSNVFITGRSKDMIIINGRNIWPQDIEYLAEVQAEIRTGDAAAFYMLDLQGDELAVLVVEYQGAEQQQRLELKNRIGRKIRQELGIDCTIELVPRNTINRTTSGKPSRHATKKGYLQQISADRTSKTIAFR